MQLYYNLKINDSAVVAVKMCIVSSCALMDMSFEYKLGSFSKVSWLHYVDILANKMQFSCAEFLRIHVMMPACRGAQASQIL